MSQQCNKLQKVVNLQDHPKLTVIRPELIFVTRTGLAVQIGTVTDFHVSPGAHVRCMSTDEEAAAWMHFERIVAQPGITRR